ncbi:4-(cytidine 5'-diphospho)-2-C-methyl-D-erythritol kinase [Alteripontixanthobacter maritimus]|uniref:4-diphosphocytidyl-2-C-methyl-D-erythritol kinase n=1 Tax=Alteripontixanthobacter maritimus TaxID=2161824 RepID=A0A369Q5U8_9SPHN|nr:4-(cytidine 5'-diphospho)-2-C-methyl-D-erythritol kinase [Alteripontixanthobacter maritimus]RDC60094.1 4-(cytidine 5'-diphospho)-2-C-methyl-D-erythritol kinase [Alteripontixanthobacter maritimus]
MRETAYAKINLALHVRARRDDGYHELETVFAFVDSGDTLTAGIAEQDSLTTVGEFAQQPIDPFDNLVMRALGKLPRPNGLAITLDKALPVAAGLGGGSADAGAVFRIVKALQGLPDGWQDRAASLGADVPACVASTTCIGRGTGTVLEPVASDWTGLPVLLVNPRIPLSTGPVFAAWDGTDRGPLTKGPVSQIALAGRNDLQLAAISLCPPIAEILTALDRTGPLLARMSGSGATCFAIYERHDVMLEVAETVARAHPDWWQMTGNLR